MKLESVRLIGIISSECLFYHRRLACRRGKRGCEGLLPFRFKDYGPSHGMPYEHKLLKSKAVYGGCNVFAGGSHGQLVAFQSRFAMSGQVDRHYSALLSKVGNLRLPAAPVAAPTMNKDKRWVAAAGYIGLPRVSLFGPEIGAEPEREPPEEEDDGQEKPIRGPQAKGAFSDGGDDRQDRGGNGEQISDQCQDGVSLGTKSKQPEHRVLRHLCHFFDNLLCSKLIPQSAEGIAPIFGISLGNDSTCRARLIERANCLALSRSSSDGRPLRRQKRFFPKRTANLPAQWNLPVMMAPFRLRSHSIHQVSTSSPLVEVPKSATLLPRKSLLRMKVLTIFAGLIK